MGDKIWQKIKSKHSLLMVLCCLAPMILIIGFLSWFKDNNYFVWLIVLLCPILHIWMMRGHEPNNSCEKEKDEKNKILYKCPKCGLEYEEKKWMEKCGAWCEKHKSCNLEITKHAIKK